MNSDLTESQLKDIIVHMYKLTKNSTAKKEKNPGYIFLQYIYEIGIDEEINNLILDQNTSPWWVEAANEH